MKAAAHPGQRPPPVPGGEDTIARIGRAVPDLTRRRIDRLVQFVGNLRDESLPLITTGYELVAESRPARKGNLIAFTVLVAAALCVTATGAYLLTRATSSTPAAVAAETSAPMAPSPRHYVVQPGDTLGTIAAEELGDVGRWRELAEHNAAVIPDPNIVEVGTRLVLPER